jgi:hypothetical protein
MRRSWTLELPEPQEQERGRGSGKDFHVLVRRAAVGSVQDRNSAGRQVLWDKGGDRESTQPVFLT